MAQPPEKPSLDDEGTGPARLFALSLGRLGLAGKNRRCRNCAANLGVGSIDLRIVEDKP